MQDFTGVPAVVDLASMREAMSGLGGEPKRINPLSPVDLGDRPLGHGGFLRQPGLLQDPTWNGSFERNGERYAFPALGGRALSTISASCRPAPASATKSTWNTWPVWSGPARTAARPSPNPDTLVGTDSHTTMVNGLAVLGWGVGGIEAEAAMLGQPVTMLIPEVVGVRLTGALREGTTATDLVLTVVEMLRKQGVVGKFVEFTGPGLDVLGLADRGDHRQHGARIRGRPVAFSRSTRRPSAYLDFTGRDEQQVALVEAYGPGARIMARQGRARAGSSPILWSSI